MGTWKSTGSLKYSSSPRAKAATQERTRTPIKWVKTTTPPAETELASGRRLPRPLSSLHQLLAAGEEWVPCSFPRGPRSFAEESLPVSGQACRQLLLLSGLAPTCSHCHLPDPTIRPPRHPEQSPQSPGHPSPDPDSTAAQRAEAPTCPLTSDPDPGLRHTHLPGTLLLLRFQNCFLAPSLAMASPHPSDPQPRHPEGGQPAPAALSCTPGGPLTDPGIPESRAERLFRLPPEVVSPRTRKSRLRPRRA